MSADRWSAFDLAEGFHLYHAVDSLRKLGIFDLLQEPQTSARLAESGGLNQPILAALLDYVVERTELLARDDDHYSLTPEYSPEARFYLDQYVGAYGPNSLNLPTILRDPASAGSFVDRDQHAAAWIAYGKPGHQLLPDVIRQLELNFVLDLGCGPGSLLLDLAESDSAFIGWGVDLNPNMCASANERFHQAGVSDQVQTFVGDCGKPEAMLPQSLVPQVQALVGMSLANEFFGGGRDQVIGWLSALRRAFPQRALILSDYYGRLGKKGFSGTRPLLIQDFVQAITGQGIPPATLDEWKEIYAEAGCSLVHVIQDPEATFFLHILRL